MRNHCAVRWGGSVKMYVDSIRQQLPNSYYSVVYTIACGD